MSRRAVRLRGVAVVLAMLGSAAVVSPAVAQESAPPGGVAGVTVPELAWTDCGDGFQCATATVPLDYDDPAGPGIDLALIRLPASDPQQRIGSMFTNFGGPGVSGFVTLREAARQLYTPELLTGLRPSPTRRAVVGWRVGGSGRRG